MEGTYEQTQTMVTEHQTKVDAPDHVFYIIGSCVLAIGCIGITGNLLVLYAFYSLHSERPMCVCSTSLLANDCCHLYAFCGALFGITSMMTLLAISVDRYCVITNPLKSIKMSSKKRSCIIITFVWLYSLGWSACPLFGWSAYVPEGLMISCTWDYVTYSPANRSYTMLLCCCVFFIPLILIFYCYLFMFLAIRTAGRNIQKLGSAHKRKDSVSQRIKSEWKLAQIAFVAIVVFVVSWSPYACVTLLAWAGYASILTPYSKSVPAIIAKASAIHNPIIYAIIHPSYRKTIRSAVPCLRFLIRESKSDFSTTSAKSSFKTSVYSLPFASKSQSRCLSSISDTKTTQNEIKFESLESVHKTEARSGLPLEAQSCDVPTKEKFRNGNQMDPTMCMSQFRLSFIGQEPLFGSTLKQTTTELLLLGHSLRTSSLPFDLNISRRGERTGTFQAVTLENPKNRSQDSLENLTLPHIVIIPTLESTLSKEQAEPENRQEENTGLFFS